MHIKPLLLGSDPEFLLRDRDTKKLISSIGIIPGTKEEPVTADELGDGYTIQIDNVLGEISVPPAKNSEELWENIQTGLNYIQDTILPDSLEIFHASSGSYSDDQLDNEIARTLGCSPSLNAWTEGINESPDASSNLRGCGCHIHLSYEDHNVQTNFELGRVFDLFCTLPTIILDDDTDRRQFYGKAGEIRHTSYGVEFRTLGGFLLRDKQIYDYILGNLDRAIEFINNGNEIDSDLSIGIQIAINTQSKSIAQDIINMVGIPFPYNELKKA